LTKIPSREPDLFGPLRKKKEKKFMPPVRTVNERLDSLDMDMDQVIDLIYGLADYLNTTFQKWHRQAHAREK
jgi:hypothetical protein